MTKGENKSTKLSVKVATRKKISETNDVLENTSKPVFAKDSVKKMKENILSYEIIEKKKRAIMWSGVTFFMILVVVFWVYNIKQVFVATTIQSESSGADLGDWKEMSDQVFDQVGDIKNVIGEFKGVDNKEVIGEETALSEKDLSILPASDDSDYVVSTSTVEIAGTSTAEVAGTSTNKDLE